MEMIRGKKYQADDSKGLPFALVTDNDRRLEEFYSNLDISYALWQKY
jgi:hypothetical protein